MSNYDPLIAPQDQIEKVKATVGRTIYEILLKESELDVYEVLGSIEVLVSSKIGKGLETSPSERMVFALTWLAREVGSGGFRQFFINSAGDFWKDALHGLNAVGDETGRAMFRQCLSVFPNSTPSIDRQTRLQQLATLEDENERKLADHLSKSTASYFRDPFPQWNLIFNYVKSHPEEFDLRSA